MNWETPAFVEINMSAEIGGYQSDFGDPIRWPARTAAADRRSERRSSDSEHRSVFARAHSRPGLGRRRRVSAVELRLPQLPRGARAGARGVRAAHAGVGRRQRRRRVLVPDQRLAGDPRADRGVPGPVAARQAALAHRRHPASPTAISTTASGLLSLRESHPLVVHATERARAASPRATSSTGRSSASPGRSTWRRARARARSSPLGATARGLARRRRCPSPGKLPLHLERLRAADRRGQRRLRDPRRAHAAGARLPLGRRRAVAGASNARCAAPTPCSSTARSGPATSCIAAGLGTRRAEDMAHWPVGGAERQPRVSGASAARARRDLHPHQQHQPDPARGRRRAARGGGAPASRSPTTAWRSAVTRRPSAAPLLSPDEFVARLRARGRAPLPRPAPVPPAHARRASSRASSCRRGC